jgi:hypothetical protein
MLAVPLSSGPPHDLDPKPSILSENLSARADLVRRAYSGRRRNRRAIRSTAITPAAGKPKPSKGPGPPRGGRASASAGSIVANNPTPAAPTFNTAYAYPLKPRMRLIPPECHRKSYPTISMSVYQVHALFLCRWSRIRNFVKISQLNAQHEGVSRREFIPVWFWSHILAAR